MIGDQNLSGDAENTRRDKLAPVDSSQLTFLPSSKSHDTKPRQISKIRPDQI